MAFIADFTCPKCHLPRQEVRPPAPRSPCAECRAAEDSRARRTHLASLKGLTLEERISRLEEHGYDADVYRRLNALEAQNARY